MNAGNGGINQLQEQVLSKNKCINIPIIQERDLFGGDQNFQKRNSRRNIFNSLDDMSKCRGDKG